MTLVLAEAPPRRTVADRRRYAGRVPAGTRAFDTTDHPFAADASQLRAVYDEHGPLIHSICRRSLDAEAADDVTQEVFLSAWRARDRFDPTLGTPAAWLVGIAKRRIIDHLRSERRHADRRADDVPQLTDERAATVDRTVDRMVVAEALLTLPERARTVIELAYLHDLTHHDVAERTGLPLGTVKSDIRRGLQRIKDHLDAIHV